MKLMQSVVLAAKKMQPGFMRLGNIIVCCPCLGQYKRCRLDSILQFAKDLASPHDIPAINIKARDHTNDGARELDPLVRLDNALEFCCVWSRQILNTSPSTMCCVAPADRFLEKSS